ncbi:MAG: FTR1 family iron permease [Burkholderiaceae bacterium]
MFGAGLIVFRESLEAALLIGIIAAATRGLSKRNLWIAMGVITGLVGSFIVAGLTEYIAQLANGSGQELFNAAILGIAVVMIGWHNIWMASHGAEMANKARQVGADIRDGAQELSAIAIVVALAVLREGSETVLFLQGIVSSDQGQAATILMGGAFGLVAGILVGFVIYAGLVRIPIRKLFSVTGALLLLVAAGLAGQMARFLIQGDWLPSLASPLWDSTSILPINSALGSTLHILIGYESRPSGTQVLFYLVTLVCIAVAASIVRRRSAFNKTGVA